MGARIPAIVHATDGSPGEAGTGGAGGTGGVGESGSSAGLTASAAPRAILATSRLIGGSTMIKRLWNRFF
jgi:hypothetical protein